VALDPAEESFGVEHAGGGPAQHHPPSRQRVTSRFGVRAIEIMDSTVISRSASDRWSYLRGCLENVSLTHAREVASSTVSQGPIVAEPRRRVLSLEVGFCLPAAGALAAEGLSELPP
jgi:hypothetical protein